MLDSNISATVNLKIFAKEKERFIVRLIMKTHSVVAVPAARRSLARDISIALGIKIFLITLAGFFLFGSDTRPHVDPNVIAEHILAKVPTPTVR